MPSVLKTPSGRLDFTLARDTASAVQWAAEVKLKQSWKQLYRKGYRVVEAK